MIASLLNILGNNPENIKNSLIKMGIKGEKESICNCPIANYLYKKTGTKYSVSSVLILNTENNKYSYPSEAISKFIEMFDMDEFPELSEEA